MKTGRNDPCPCGSGRKFKHCCGVGAAAAAATPSAARGADPAAELPRLAALMNGGRFEEAENRGEALVARHPEIGLAWKVYGAARAMLGRDALPALLTAARLLPADAEVRYYLGNAYRARGDVDGAIDAYRRAVERRPDFTEAYNELGRALLERGEPEPAKEALRRALAGRPDDAAALGNLANALRVMGRVREAVDGYRRVVALAPGLAEAHHNLGTALWELGEHAEAIACYRRALGLRPAYHEALAHLAQALEASGRAPEALAHFQQALAASPESADLQSAYGALLVRLRRYDAAAEAYRRSLAIRPQDAGSYASLGYVERCRGDLHAAIESCRRAIAIDAASASAWLNLGNALLDLGQLPEAEGSYRRALLLAPDDPLVHTALAMLLRRDGRIAEAEASAERAVALGPGAADSLAFLADLRADRGRFDEAGKLLARATAAAPDQPEGWIGVPRYRRMTAADSGWLAGAERVLAGGLAVGHEINLRHAVGKYFEDLGDYERAFESHRRANELTRRYGPGHDRESLERRVEAIVARYDRAWIDAVHAAANGSQRPVFIVGMPRSGTTLAEQILAAHPAVHAAGELVYWNTALAATERSLAAGAERATVVAALAGEYLERLAALSPAAQRVVDKLPGNFLNLGLIHAALPNARVIHMQRDPLDTCLSVYFQGFTTAHAYAADLGDLAHYYRQYRRLMAHWRALLPPAALLEVPYEALVDDPETWSRRMLEHVGLPWDARCLEFHRAERPVLTASNWQVRQAIGKGSVGRWRRYQQFLGPLRGLES